MDNLTKVRDVMQLLDELEENAATYVGTELDRIVDLPIVRPLSPKAIERLSREVIDAEFYDGPEKMRLLRDQAQGFHEFREFEGLFGLIGVGNGKTLLSMLCSDFACNELGCSTSLIVVPSNTFGQFKEVDLAWIRPRVNVRSMVHLLGDMTRSKRRGMATSGYPGVYVMPYSLLSTVDTDELLEAIAPGCIILDEAHYVKDPSAARTRRLMQALRRLRQQEGPPTRFGVMSGTMTSKGLHDYHHLITAALGEEAPVPMSTRVALAWGDVLNAGARPKGHELLGLVDWAHDHFPKARKKFTSDVSGFRRAYKARLQTAPGVVMSRGRPINTVLTIANRPVKDFQECDGWPELYAIAKRIEKKMIAPNGDEIEHEVHAYTWLSQLTAGFYYDLYWPEAGELAEAQQVSDSEADDWLDRAEDHHEARQEYAKELRRFLRRPPSGMDTPFLVGNEMHLHGHKKVGKKLFGLWRTMKELESDELPDRWRHPIRICDYKIQAACDWAEDIGGEKGLIFYWHTEVGKWLHEEMQRRGVSSTLYPAGDNVRILKPEAANNVAIASVRAHGQGKNLQHFKHQCYVEWTRPAGLAEQSLGRLHRTGQDAEEIEVRTFNTLSFDRYVFAATLQDAIYVHQSATPQRLITCTYDPMPKVFTTEFLTERGLQPHGLTTTQRKLLNDRFGAMTT